MIRLITAACAVAVLTATSACSLTESNDKSESKGAGTITVDSTAKACKLTTTKAPSGNVAFKVKNWPEFSKALSERGIEKRAFGYPI